MKGCWGALALALATAMVAGAARAEEMDLWRGARLFMKPDAISKLFPGATRPETVLKVAGPATSDLSAPVSVAGHPARATFYFIEHQLWEVGVTVTDPAVQNGEAGLEMAKAVAGQIDEDLGQRPHCETSGEAGARRYDCAWPAIGDRLAYLSYAEQAAGPPLLSIVFRAGSLPHEALVTDGVLNAAKTVVNDDAFSSAIEFDSPFSLHNPWFGDTVEYSLRSWMDRSTKTVTHQLYVTITYAGGVQNDFKWAADNTADALRVVKLGRYQTRCKDCTRDETVGVALDADKLVGGLTHPCQVKLSAKSGDEAIITVAPGMILGQLMAIAAHGGPPAPGADQIVEATPLDFGATLETAPAKPNRPAGAKVGRVAGDGVAPATGLRGGDLITALDGATVDGAPAAQTAIAAIPPGRRVLVSILRGNQPMTLQAQF